MPKAAPRTSGPKASTSRSEPYIKPSPKNAKGSADKENVNPTTTSSSKTKTQQGDYRDIHIDEVMDEIPCYDNAATVRRKLKKLLTDKSTIPGTSKKWSQASMAGEMQELEQRGHPVEYNRNASGPTSNSLSGFLKKSGQMGGGDNPCYYWGYVMLEKMRIHSGEKKSKPRLKTEKEIPTGHRRCDPKTQHFLCGPGLPPPSLDELNNAGR